MDPIRGRLGREALVVGPKHQKVFTVDFSEHEYTAGKVQVELDHYTIYVYPPAMIALEKLRAICQHARVRVARKDQESQNAGFSEHL